MIKRIKERLPSQLSLKNGEHTSTEVINAFTAANPLCIQLRMLAST
jgi:hypothetical protein